VLRDVKKFAILLNIGRRQRIPETGVCIKVFVIYILDMEMKCLKKYFDANSEIDENIIRILIGMRYLLKDFTHFILKMNT